jgi:hypothetical protein
MEIKPQAVVIPKETDQFEKGKYGPIFPKTPACYGFTIIANVKPGKAETIRSYGYRLAEALEADPYVLAPLKLHYLRWVLFDNDTRFMYQGIFDTDFDKYTEDAIALFTKTGINTVFENLEGFPKDWKTNPEAFIKFVRDHQCPSFIEYGEYPYVTADEIKKALKIKSALSEWKPGTGSSTRSSGCRRAATGRAMCCSRTLQSSTHCSVAMRAWKTSGRILPRQSEVIWKREDL